MSAAGRELWGDSFIMSTEVFKTITVPKGERTLSEEAKAGTIAGWFLLRNRLRCAYLHAAGVLRGALQSNSYEMKKGKQDWSQAQAGP